MKRATFYQNRVDTGMAHLAAGETGKARLCFNAVLEKVPGHPDAMHGLACLARAQGDPGRAIAMIGPVIRRADLPDAARAQYHLTLGYALGEAGHIEPARAAFSVAHLLAPQDYRARLGLGEMLLRQGKHSEGLCHWSTALEHASDIVPILQRCGEILMGLRLFDDAVSYFEKIVALMHDDGVAWANLGAALFEAGRMVHALSAFDTACARGADNAYTRLNRALTCLARGLFSEAESDMAKAKETLPHDRRVRNNAATLDQQTGRETAAEAEYAALMQGDDHEAAQAAFNLGTLRLAQGRMVEGWQLFENRLRVVNWHVPLPKWEGAPSPIPALIVAEQGAGDFIQFLRYLPEALSRVPVILQAARPLKCLVTLNDALAQAMRQGRLRFCDEGGSHVEAGSHCAMMSLPFLLGKGLPDPNPYLSCPDTDHSDTEPRGRLRVGICWAGAKDYRFDERRSVDPSLLQKLFSIEKISFVAIQRRGASAPWPDALKAASTQDWVATARALARCDLVISVDTAVAHLAGALGRPLWLLHRYGGDWRWEGPEWYHNVTIFRAGRAEPPVETWKPVIAKLQERLGALVGA